MARSAASAATSSRRCLPGTVDIGLLESLARTLIEQVSRPYTIEGHKVTIGASVGIAIGDPGRASADALVRNADLALYAAKAAGRGKHCFYEPSMHSEAAERQLLENDLRQAIERGELCGRITSRSSAPPARRSRASRRWSAGTIRRAAPISPDKFIPLAEEAGLIGKIGEWVLRTALEEAAHWPDHVRVAVNLSPLQFNDPSVVDMVAEPPAARPASAPSGSSWRSPKACSSPRATPPTRPSPS